MVSPTQESTLQKKNPAIQKLIKTTTNRAISSIRRHICILLSRHLFNPISPRAMSPNSCSLLFFFKKSPNVSQPIHTFGCQVVHWPTYQYFSLIVCYILQQSTTKVSFQNFHFCNRFAFCFSKKYLIILCFQVHLMMLQYGNEINYGDKK